MPTLFVLLEVTNKRINFTYYMYKKDLLNFLKDFWLEIQINRKLALGLFLKELRCFGDGIKLDSLFDQD